MNLLNKKWIKYGNFDIKIKHQKNNSSLILKNDTGKIGFIVIPKLFKFKKENLNISFYGKSLCGLGCVLNILSLRKNVEAEITLNSESLVNISAFKHHIICIKILPYSEVEIYKLIQELSDEEEDFYSGLLKSENDTLVITPSYPSSENKYLCGFVHSRLLEYKKQGMKFDVICSHDYKEMSKYNFEGIDVLRIPFFQLRNILRVKKYKKILVHFFDFKYANVFDSCDLSQSQLYFWVHGPETLYWDWPKFTTSYFSELNEITDEQKKIFTSNDLLIEKYNKMSNVKWIFVSEWIKKRSEELINIKFNNFIVISNIINESDFNYVKKLPEQRKSIFFIRRFDDCNKYAIDINVRCILELSKRKCFNDLNFNIYGIGDTYEKLVKPLKQFSNVHLYPKFLSHEEIACIHKENGIGLFATRYDAQGVSMCEAAMSGLAVITSKNEAVMEFLPNDIDIFAETENYMDYADKIEYLYNNPKEFEKYSERCHEEVKRKCSYKFTVKKEIELLSIVNKDLVNNNMKIEGCVKPILTVVIPAYNISEFLPHLVKSLLNQNNANKLEIIIVNDGSKDNTVQVATSLMSQYNVKGMEVIKLIDKMNGGHGSTINIGLEKATGKYFRVIDGDDYVNSKDFESLIDRLENDESDIIITNYCEDRADINVKKEIRIYSNILPDVEYKFDDLCYDNYGFKEWGPILATANFKTKMLKKSKYKLSEKSSYVDMEFDLISIINAETIKYYDLDIYRYFIGRPNQTISEKSYVRNFKQHEKVLFRLIEILYNDTNLTFLKKEYAKNHLIIPMVKTQYFILTDYMESSKEFNKFDKVLGNYKDFYFNHDVCTRYIKMQRLTHGIFLKFSKSIKKIYFILRKG